MTKETRKRKATKAEARYEHPAKGMDNCIDCKYYHIESHQCDEVAGEVFPKDWCKFFKPKEPK